MLPSAHRCPQPRNDKQYSAVLEKYKVLSAIQQIFSFSCIKVLIELLEFFPHLKRKLYRVVKILVNVATFGCLPSFASKTRTKI